jgi:hypothetical protein
MTVHTLECGDIVFVNDTTKAYYYYESGRLHHDRRVLWAVENGFNNYFEYRKHLHTKLREMLEKR